MTTLRRIIVAASLMLVAGTCWADQSNLKPRQAIRKTPTVALRVPYSSTGRLIVKFRDEYKVRPTANGSVRSASMADVDNVEAVLAQFRLKARPAINHPESTLQALEARAANVSGKAQPDLAGILHVDGSRRTLLQAACALNNLDEVEFVQFEVQNRVAQEDPDCGVGEWEDTLDCFIDNNNTPFCNDEECCREICDNLDPYCCAEDTDGQGVWDYLCAAYANLICAAGDRCASAMNGSCFDVHGYPGCNKEECCNNICDNFDPRCCTQNWDQICVWLAQAVCTEGGAGGDTPNFEPLQAYKNNDFWWNLDEVPEELKPYVATYGAFDENLFIGYDGYGWNMQDPDDEYGGLHGLAQELLDLYGIDGLGLGNLSYGKTVKVAVIEDAYWGPEPFEDDNNNGEWDAGESYSDLNGDGQYNLQHEDLDVILEEGQTLIQIPQLTRPDHGTAILSIIDGVKNGFGVTGLAHQCKSYFFPTTSVEEGPRQDTAWISAMNELGQGDVISVSYYPDDDVFFNLNNQPASWLWIRMASDLGITVCIAAGNGCVNLDDAPDQGDSGGIVVGACSPGSPWYRLPYSNFCTTSNVAISNTVHIKAWGAMVTAAGYGDLYYGDGDPLRSYTPNFSYTSAAAPQIAGLVACLQGFAKQYYGIPLMPEQIRAVLGIPMDIPEGNRRLLIGGFGDTVECGFDVNEDEGPNLIGPYPEVESCAARIVSGSEDPLWSGFNDSPLIDEIGILRGTHVYGNIFSVKSPDNSYYTVQSLYTVPGDSPSGGGQPGSQQSPFGSGNGFGGSGPGGQVEYIGAGQVVDLMAIGHSDIDVVNALRVTTESPYTGRFTILLVELYNWVDMRWQFLNAEVMNGPGEDGADLAFGHVAVYADRYVRPVDDKIFMRIWTLSLTGGMQGDGGYSGTYNYRLDWLNLEVSEDYDAFVDDGGA